jgi:hypothetical protein
LETPGQPFLTVSDAGSGAASISNDGGGLEMAADLDVVAVSRKVDRG